MANSEEADRSGPFDELDRSEGRSFKTKAILGVTAVSLLAISWIFTVAVIPRWWARRLGNLIDGRLAFGSLLGLTVGFLFTVVPLLILRVGWRRRKGWRRAIVTLVVAVIVAAPNLATLGIVTGNGNAAHDGERILGVDGPGFRGGSLVGAVVGALVAAVVIYLAWSRQSNKRKAKRLKYELDEERG